VGRGQAPGDHPAGFTHRVQRLIVLDLHHVLPCSSESHPGVRAVPGAILAGLAGGLGRTTVFVAEK
jgi:hypothetical protein